MCPRGKRGLPGEQSALALAPRGHETHFYPSPEAAFHFISWTDAEVIYSVSAKICLKKNTVAFGNLGGNWVGSFQINCNAQLEYRGHGEGRVWTRQCLGGENDWVGRNGQRGELDDKGG